MIYANIIYNSIRYLVFLSLIIRSEYCKNALYYLFSRYYGAFALYSHIQGIHFYIFPTISENKKKKNIFYSSQNCKLRKCETWLL